MVYKAILCDITVVFRVMSWDRENSSLPVPKISRVEKTCSESEFENLSSRLRVFPTLKKSTFWSGITQLDTHSTFIGKYICLEDYHSVKRLKKIVIGKFLIRSITFSSACRFFSGSNMGTGQKHKKWWNLKEKIIFFYLPKKLWPDLPHALAKSRPRAQIQKFCQL